MKMYFLLKMGILRCYASLSEGNDFFKEQTVYCIIVHLFMVTFQHKKW